MGSRRQLRLRFTREGKYFVALCLGIGFAAVNTGNNLLYLILGMMLALIIASGVLSELSLRGLEVARRAPGRIFAGQPFLMELRLTNRKRRIASFSIEVEDLLAGRPLERKCYFLKLPAGRTHQAAYRHSFARRGAYQLSGFELATRFPFSLFRKSMRLAGETELVVYPAIHALHPGEVSQQAGGEEGQGRPGRRGEFHGLKEYQAGDDPRSIHWRKSAQRGRLVVRQHEDQTTSSIAIFLDNRCQAEVLSPEDLDLQERLVSRAASLAAHYSQRGYQVRLVTRTVALPAGTGPSQLTRILHALALLEFVGDERPFAAPAQRPGACVFVGPTAEQRQRAS